MIVICAHRKREQQALALAHQVGGLVVWDERDDEVETHWRAWQLARDSREWGIVLEDDAIPVKGFAKHAEDALAVALDMLPGGQPPVVSFYTGTSRPDPKVVTASVTQAHALNASWLASRRLRWGVGVAIHATQIDSMLSRYRRFTVPSDQRISEWAQWKKATVLHTFPSLVDHRDEEPVITKRHDGQPRDEPRVAHSFGEPLAWNAISVPMG